jgi:hypothetical protein
VRLAARAAATPGTPADLSNLLRPGETPAQAEARRRLESARVAERSKRVSTREELDAAFELAPAGGLVIVDIFSNQECFVGTDAVATWRTPTLDETMAPCVEFAASLARLARDSPDVTFVSLEGDATPAARALAEELGVREFPTVQARHPKRRAAPRAG